MLLQVVLLMVLQSAAAHMGDVEIAADPGVRGIFAYLLEQPRRSEHAAFIVRTECGGFTFVMWPESVDENSVRWSGGYPHGTVAIVHTHPNWLPMPSRIDIRSAASARVPIYVVTSSRITKTDGSSVQVIQTLPL